MTYTLGIDTSHHVAVGVARDGEVVARSVVEDSRAHVEELVPSVLRACAEVGIALTDIDEIAVYDFALTQDHVSRHWAAAGH